MLSDISVSKSHRSNASLIISIARLAGTFIVRWIGVRPGKRTACWTFFTLAAAGFASARFLDSELSIFLAVFCVSVMMMSVASSMNTALFADTVVYGECETGKSIRAITMALMNFSIKVGVLIRSAIVAGGLMAIGFVANADPTPPRSGRYPVHDDACRGRRICGRGSDFLFRI
jgi:Na+/melibiose symporter-like transporter